MGAKIGMTMVLHTHNRKPDFHPHLHTVVSGGGVDKHRRQWKKKNICLVLERNLPSQREWPRA